MPGYEHVPRTLRKNAKFAKDKPHFIKQDHGTVTYYIGPGADDIVSLNLLD